MNLPTPTVSDIYTANLKSSQQKEGSMHSVTLAQVIQRTGSSNVWAMNNKSEVIS